MVSSSKLRKSLKSRWLLRWSRLPRVSALFHVPQSSTTWSSSKVLGESDYLAFKYWIYSVNEFSLDCFPSSCASFVGCQGGEQPVYISKVCRAGNLCHEIMHALGLHHEHTRQDRDQYVTIEWDNILKGEHVNRIRWKMSGLKSFLSF